MKLSAGQLWRAPAPRVRGGFRYVRLLEVRCRGGEDEYVNAVEVSVTGEKVRPTALHQFRGSEFTINARGGVLSSPYELVS